MPVPVGQEAQPWGSRSSRVPRRLSQGITRDILWDTRLGKRRVPQQLSHGITRDILRDTRLGKQQDVPAALPWGNTGYPVGHPPG